MRIAFILSPESSISNKMNGVTKQSHVWSETLKARGHLVDFPFFENPFIAKNFDIVHFMQFGPWCRPVVSYLRNQGVRISMSPIFDPIKPYSSLHEIASKIPFEKLRLLQNQREFRLTALKCNVILARTDFEKKSIAKVSPLGTNIRVCPIAIGLSEVPDERTVQTSKRGNHVFHLSALCQERKNVKRLVQACIEAQIDLRLAGRISKPEFRAWLERITLENSNIRYLGVIEDGRVIQEMLSCRIFCLPSINEGVGIVALDAMVCGAQVVASLTGGTSEYLGSFASYVDPHSVKSIRDSLVDSLKRSNFSLKGRDQILMNYSPERSAIQIESIFSDILSVVAKD